MIKGFYDNPKTISVPEDAMWMGIQDGKRLEDMGRISYGNFIRPIEKLIVDLANGWIWQEEVIAVLPAPPLSPQDGERFVIDKPASGVWIDRAGYIATYVEDTSSWTYEEPKERWAVFVYNTSEVFIRLYNEWKKLGDFGKLTEILEETENARDEVLLNEGFIVVSQDLLNENNIGTVADNIQAIIPVSLITDNIVNVDNNKVNINKVANIDTDIVTIVGIKAEIENVSAIRNNVVSVDGNKNNINIVASNKNDIVIVAGIDTEVTILAGIKTEIEGVYAIRNNITAVDNNKVNINAVADNKNNIDKVASIDTEIIDVADIKADVENVSYIKDNVVDVSTNRDNIDKVAEIDADVTTVAGIKTKVSDLADRKVKIDAIYNDLPTIEQKANKTYVDTELEKTRGNSWDNTSIMDILSQYAVANGIATLDGNGKVYISQIPSIPLMDVHVVSSQSAMLSLSAVKGDIAIRDDIPSVFILSSDSPSTLADWIELSDLQSAVDSALAVIKGVGWNGETVKENADNFKAHTLSYTPHRFKNLKTGIVYEYGFQISELGNPQLIYKEI